MSGATMAKTKTGASTIAATGFLVSTTTHRMIRSDVHGEKAEPELELEVVEKARAKDGSSRSTRPSTGGQRRRVFGHLEPAGQHRPHTAIDTFRRIVPVRHHVAPPAGAVRARLADATQFVTDLVQQTQRFVGRLRPRPRCRRLGLAPGPAHLGVEIVAQLVDFENPLDAHLGRGAARRRSGSPPWPGPSSAGTGCASRGCPGCAGRSG